MRSQEVEYLIVGQGIAGSCFALKLLRENKTFVLIDDNRQNASRVAVGIYNPVVLKRFSLIWNAEEQMNLLDSYFLGFGKLTSKNYLQEIPIFRILHDENEIHAWKKKAKNPNLAPFLNPKIFQDVPADFVMPYGYAEVYRTGRIELQPCLDDFRNFLIENDAILQERFDFEQLQIRESGVQYRNIYSNKIVFCDGFGIKANPFFKDLPIIGVKGEVLKIKTKNTIPTGIWKAKCFLFPIEGNYAYTASTYDRDNLSPEPTEKGKQEIVQQLREYYAGDFEIVEHTAGIRPTVIDRRPILGNHHLHQNLYILNGMGTRGTLLAPQMSEFLYDFIEFGKELSPEINIRRFDAD